MKESIVVVTAHVGDFVWRAGGAIALHAANGVPVHLICLSYGENGESNIAWSAAEADRQSVKSLRRAEAEAAAVTLGAESVDFYDIGDYPMTVTAEVVDRLSKAFRQHRPGLLITHPERDPSNLDHCQTFQAVLAARMKALAPGHGSDFIKPQQVLCFEPHQSELCGFKPNMLLDITSVWPQKQEAMRTMPTQRNLWDYYERVALQRGAQAGRRKESATRYGEAYQSIFPSVHTLFIE